MGREVAGFFAHDDSILDLIPYFYSSETPDASHMSQYRTKNDPNVGSLEALSKYDIFKGMNSKPKKIRIAVLYGGRSSEHEVALVSAASVIGQLDPEKYEIVPIGVDPQGRWHMGSLGLIEDGIRQGSLPILKQCPEVSLLPYPATDAQGQSELVPVGKGQLTSSGAQAIDVVFPVMHGTNGEDGTIQGFLEMSGVPYVGCGVLASSVAMDKDVAKKLFIQAGLPTVPGRTLKSKDWRLQSQTILQQIEQEFEIPVFVKPCNVGSSVGAHKVKDWSALQAAIDDAFLYDQKVLVERAIDAREIEFAVLENTDPLQEPKISVPGEIRPSHEFYSYEAKYLDEAGADLIIPAELEEEQIQHAQDLALKAFSALECEGMARVDLFLDRKTGEFWINEINTIPGFTKISMYPKLMNASGLPYPKLLDHLVELALRRHEERSQLRRSRG